MATVPSEMTAVAGSILTAAQWNSNVRDAVNFLITPPLFIGYQTVTQSIANAAFVPVLFDTEIIDSDGGHSTATNTSRYTAQTPGYYQPGGGPSLVANSTGVRWTRWAVNGTPVIGSQFSATAVQGQPHELPMRSFPIYLNVGDYLEMFVQQTSGAALGTDTTPGTPNVYSLFSCLWIRTA